MPNTTAPTTPRPMGVEIGTHRPMRTNQSTDPRRTFCIRFEYPDDWTDGQAFEWIENACKATVHPEAVPANNRDATTPPILGGDHEEEPSSIPAQRTSLGAEAGTSTDPLPPKALEAASNAIRDELRECDSDEWTPEYLAECGLRAALPHMTIQANAAKPKITEEQALRLIREYNAGYAIVDALVRAGFEWPDV